jgi:hypothetical protein
MKDGDNYLNNSDFNVCFLLVRVCMNMCLFKKCLYLRGHDVRVIYYYYYGSTALCLVFALFSVSWSNIKSVGLLGRGIRPSQGRYLHTEQHRHRINTKKHPCLEWDSNPRSQRSSERKQFMPQTARPLWSACYIYIYNPLVVIKSCIFIKWIILKMEHINTA